MCQSKQIKRSESKFKLLVTLENLNSSFGPSSNICVKVNKFEFFFWIQILLLLVFPHKIKLHNTYLFNFEFQISNFVSDRKFKNMFVEDLSYASSSLPHSIYFLLNLHHFFFFFLLRCPRVHFGGIVYRSLPCAQSRTGVT